MPELVVGFVGPLGSNLPGLISATEHVLGDMGYTHPVRVKLTDHFPWVAPQAGLPKRGTVSVQEWYEKNMNAGDNLRHSVEEKSAAVITALRGIALARAGLTSDPSGVTPSKDTVYFLDSLKTPEEVALLRAIYGPWFVLIASHCPRDVRVNNLAHDIHEKDELSSLDARGPAEDLVTRDEEGESRLPYGQNVREAFALADLYVRNSDKRTMDVRQVEELRKALQRFFGLLFRRAVHTPTSDEHGMFMAHAASLRSSVPSRKVGAALCSNVDGQVIAVGTNEVPKEGGGAYWEGDPKRKDGRSSKEDDPGRAMRDKVLRSFFERLEEAGYPYPEDLTTPDARVKHFQRWQVQQEKKGIRARTLFDDAIEYNREVHAELLALTDAARRGVRSQGEDLFTTTFPCHDCAKHIVAAGVGRVVYLEPYAKSLVREFYTDSIHIEGDARPSDDASPRVMFANFVGISPRRYATLFRGPGDVRRGADQGVPEREVRLTDYGDSYDVRPASTLTFVGILGELLSYQWLKRKIEGVEGAQLLATDEHLLHDHEAVATPTLATLGGLTYEQPAATTTPEEAMTQSSGVGETRAERRRRTTGALRGPVQLSTAWEAAGRVWWAADRMTDGRPTTEEFAALVEEAASLGHHRLDSVTDKWVREKLDDLRTRRRKE